MACGCGNRKSVAPPDSRRLRTLAFMCVTCPHLTGHPEDPATNCGVSGQPVYLTVRGMASCPIGRHPDKDGVVEWAGLDWIGHPAPLAWLYRWRWWRRRLTEWHEGPEPPPLSGPLMGCGCWLQGKLAWMAARRWWKRVRGRPSGARRGSGDGYTDPSQPSMNAEMSAGLTQPSRL